MDYLSARTRLMTYTTPTKALLAKLRLSTAWGAILAFPTMGAKEDAQVRQLCSAMRRAIEADTYARGVPQH